jgi:hypothetical protein
LNAPTPRTRGPQAEDLKEAEDDSFAAGLYLHRRQDDKMIGVAGLGIGHRPAQNRRRKEYICIGKQQVIRIRLLGCEHQRVRLAQPALG